MPNRLLVIGAGGFIGKHLLKRMSANPEWEVIAVDLPGVVHGPCHIWHELDIMEDDFPVQALVGSADVVLPLAAIANPSVYVKDPMRVFELDFEANLRIVRTCAKMGRRLVFPSTSEVYGMCEDITFNPYSSRSIYGPVTETRWIYACAKQMLDRVIFALGQRDDLQFTLFRPFNWVGPGMDNIKSPKAGASRVLTQFVGNALRGEPLVLVGGGEQRRCFTHVHDGIAALARIIEKKPQRNIYNIGDPSNNFSIRELAEIVREKLNSMSEIVSADASEFFGPGYADVIRRVPCIEDTMRDLHWKPRLALTDAILMIAQEY